MNKVNKVLLSITCVALLGALGSGIYLLIAKNRVKGKELIQVTNVNSTLTTECNLGVISPGETKEQGYIIESLVDKDISFSLRFEISSIEKACNYINLNAYIEDETIVNKKFSDSFNTTYSYKKKIKKNESKELIIQYTLAKDIPNEIIGTHLDFTLILQTNAFL